jgi:hypothetical protein
LWNVRACHRALPLELGTNFYDWTRSQLGGVTWSLLITTSIYPFQSLIIHQHARRTSRFRITLTLPPILPQMSRIVSHCKTVPFCCGGPVGNCSRPLGRVWITEGLNWDQEAQVETSGQLHPLKQEEPIPWAIHMWISPYADEHSRVRLNEPDGEGYINANWVPMPHGKLIITQGPL